MSWKKLDLPTDEEKRQMDTQFRGRARFLVDESMGEEVAEILKSNGYNTRYVAEVGLIGRSDEDVFAVAWAWSLDAYATDKEKEFNVYEHGGTSFGLPLPDKRIGTLLVNGDPLDPSKLLDFKPTPVAGPTAKSYSCPAIARELGFQTGSPQNLAALRTLYQTSCR